MALLAWNAESYRKYWKSANHRGTNPAAMDGSSGHSNNTLAQYCNLSKPAKLYRAQPRTHRLYSSTGLLFSSPGPWPGVLLLPRDVQGS